MLVKQIISMLFKRKILKFILCFSFITLCLNNLHAQPFIEIYLNSQIPESKGAAFSEIVETHEVYIPQRSTPNTFYVTKTYNSHGKIIKEVKKNSMGGLNSEATWEYNPKGELLQTKSRTFINMTGWINSSTILSYNDTSGHLELISEYNNGPRRHANVTCDEEGKPVELEIFNNRGEPIGVERLMTIVASNCIRVICFTSNEQFVSSHNYPINRNKPIPTSQIQRQYNEHGDVTIEMLNKKSRLNQGYFYEYEYDAYGNWVKRLTYQCDITSKNKPKNKKLEYCITRKIHY